jgi:hypothetical protein
VPSITPIDRATSTIDRPSSRTIATASRWNSGGYFDGRPSALFLLDMDFLLYEVSAQWGDAQPLEGPTAFVALVVSLGGLATSVSGVVKQWVDTDDPDCGAYVVQLKGIVADADTPSAIDAEALDQMFDEETRDECGAPSTFVNAVSGAFTPTTTTSTTTTMPADGESAPPTSEG